MEKGGRLGSITYLLRGKKPFYQVHSGNVTDLLVFSGVLNCSSSQKYFFFYKSENKGDRNFWNFYFGYRVQWGNLCFCLLPVYTQCMVKCSGDATSKACTNLLGLSPSFLPSSHPLPLANTIMGLEIVGMHCVQRAVKSVFQVAGF